MYGSLTLEHYYTDKSIQEDKREFYQGDSPMRMISGIADLNIIVGANNTRKSRFFGMLMTADSYPFWTSDTPLEDVISNLEKHVSELNKKYEGETLLSIGKGIQSHNPIKGALSLKDFMDMGHGVSDTIGVDRFSDHVLNQINAILVCRSETEHTVVVENCKQISMVLQIITEWLKGYYHQEFSISLKFITPGSKLPRFENIPIQRAELSDASLAPGIIATLSAIKHEIDKFTGPDMSFQRLTPSIIYIPVLRTSKTLAGISGDIFENSIRKHLTDLKDRVSIHTGLSLGQKILQSRNGTKQELYDFQEFEKFIGRTFFNGDDINIIAQYNDNSGISISLPGELENVSINDLGDGVSGIINLLYPIFTAAQGSWIFIEEPENNLHPGFQLIFIKALQENEWIKSKGLKVFINTHSNHILANSYLAAEQVNVMVFNRRDKNTTSIFRFHDDQKATLDLLGVMNTSVLISNCLLWVEGITDRLYIKAFLSAYIASLPKGQSTTLPREGIDYAFVEYGGKNLVHYDFSQSTGESSENIASFFINNRILVLADHDNDEAKAEKFAGIKNEYFKYISTQLPEIENILPEQVLKDFLEDLGVPAAEIAGIDFTKINSDKLGAIFDGVKKSGRKKAIAICAKHGGTLAPNYKKKLAEFLFTQVRDNKYTWPDLSTSTHLSRITKDIWNFVKKANGNRER